MKHDTLENAVARAWADGFACGVTNETSAIYPGVAERARIDVLYGEEGIQVTVDGRVHHFAHEDARAAAVFYLLSIGRY